MSTMWPSLDVPESRTVRDAMRPPSTRPLSSRVTAWPRAFSAPAQATPLMPPPTTITVDTVYALGIEGSQSARKASMRCASSVSPIVADARPRERRQRRNP